ncbi:MAG: DUF6941 family protein [Planctomycetaceae bacterium]
MSDTGLLRWQSDLGDSEKEQVRVASPVLQALLVADQVYQDAESSKFVICGVFGVVNRIATKRPSQAEEAQAEGKRRRSIGELMRTGSPWAYISLTEVQGTRKFELRYVDLSDNAVLFSTEFAVTSGDPLQTIQLRLALPELPAPHPGTYALELLCDDELLGAHRVIVKEAIVPRSGE